MSTAYFLHRIPTQEKIDELKAAIDRTRTGEGFADVQQLVSELYGEFNANYENPNEHGIIPIGHRSCGWKFLWSTNVYREVHRTEDGEFVDEYKLLYPLTRQGVLEFVMEPNYIVVDEYGDVQDKTEFLEMAFNWEKQGYTSLTSPEISTWDFSRQQEPFKKLGIEFREAWQSDFISDGLRFTIFNN